MALQQMVFSARIVDGNGRSRSCHAYYAIDDAISVNTLIGHLEGFANDIAPLTDGTITRLSLSIDDTAYAGTVKTGGAPIEQTGLLNFAATGSPRRWAQVIPAFSNAKLVGDRIDLDDIQVQNMFTDWVAGDFTNEVYQPLVQLVDAIVSFRRDRKQLQRASFETP